LIKVKTAMTCLKQYLKYKGHWKSDVEWKYQTLIFFYYSISLTPGVDAINVHKNIFMSNHKYEPRLRLLVYTKIYKFVENAKL
jgi:hypothetical protein